jgi:hypothetical protein
MNHDIINLINTEIIYDCEKKVAHYKALAEMYKVISNAKGLSHNNNRDKYLIDYVISLPDEYNKKHNNILNEIEEMVDFVIEKWKIEGIYMDKVVKYESVMF